MFSATLDLKKLRQYKLHFFEKSMEDRVSHFNISVTVKRGGVDEHRQAWLTVLNLRYHYQFVWDSRDDFTIFYLFYTSGLQKIFCDCTIFTPNHFFLIYIKHIV